MGLRWFLEELLLDTWELLKIAGRFVGFAFPLVIALYIPVAAFVVAAMLTLFMIGAL